MTRQEFMLAVLAAGNGEAHTPVQAQKLFFLLDRTVPAGIGGPWFNFQPHDYGPFDKAVYEDLRALAAKGLVAITSPQRPAHLLGDPERLVGGATAARPVSGSDGQLHPRAISLGAQAILRVPGVQHLPPIPPHVGRGRFPEAAMTVLVGVLCTDGVIVGSDSSATFGAAPNLSTIEQPIQKTFIVGNDVIFATTGCYLLPSTSV
jgi:hypothetical protein